MPSESLPKEPGTYILILRLSRQTTLSVGRLGEFEFPAGWYAYVGSAHGSGGLAARVARHQRASKKLHWHIDYLRCRADLTAVWCATGPARRECVWAEMLVELPGASIPVPRFGASDCRCPAHLIWFSHEPDPDTFGRLAEEPVSAHPFNA